MTDRDEAVSNVVEGIEEEEKRERGEEEIVTPQCRMGRRIRSGRH
ncbi:hypothetical protein LCGC14_1236240 [marine sediment metagenome]|uniref:Uncharacterized protein n=1 Tax=marine sediment metagenome TaxID=412755 RepID=A0A0F9NP94_9ZZZZ